MSSTFSKRSCLKKAKEEKKSLQSGLTNVKELKKQLEASVWGAAAPASGGTGNIQAGNLLELAGRM